MDVVPNLIEEIADVELKAPEPNVNSFWLELFKNSVSKLNIFLEDVFEYEGNFKTKALLLSAAAQLPYVQYT